MAQINSLPSEQLREEVGRRVVKETHKNGPVRTEIRDGKEFRVYNCDPPTQAAWYERAISRVWALEEIEERFLQELEFGLVEEHNEPDNARLFEFLEELFSRALLTDKQRFVIERSWGLGGVGQTHSFREISEWMGVSHQAVWGIYDRAMASLYREAQRG